MVEMVLPAPSPPVISGAGSDVDSQVSSSTAVTSPANMQDGECLPGNISSAGSRDAEMVTWGEPSMSPTSTDCRREIAVFGADRPTGSAACPANRVIKDAAL